MKCFNHPDIDAVGICKNCNKGLCMDCLTEVENGIACTSTCVEEVKLVNSLINRSKKSYRTASGAHMKNAFIYAVMGIVFIIFGLSNERLTWFLSVLGILFLVGAGLSFITANKYKSKE